MSEPTIHIRTYPEYTVETHYVDGEIHRENAPAVIKKTHAGVVLSEYFICHNKKHRVGGPATITRDRGRVSICYYKDDKLHRENEQEQFVPAVVETVNSVVVLEQYYINGRLHRDDGPAHITRDESGRITASVFYRNGERC